MEGKSLTSHNDNNSNNNHIKKTIFKWNIIKLSEERNRAMPNNRPNKERLKVKLAKKNKNKTNSMFAFELSTISSFSAASTHPPCVCVEL